MVNKDVSSHMLTFVLLIVCGVCVPATPDLVVRLIVLGIYRCRAMDVPIYDNESNV